METTESIIFMPGLNLFCFFFSLVIIFCITLQAKTTLLERENHEKSKEGEYMLAGLLISIITISCAPLFFGKYLNNYFTTGNIGKLDVRDLLWPIFRALFSATLALLIGYISFRLELRKRIKLGDKQTAAPSFLPNRKYSLSQDWKVPSKSQ